MAPPKSRTDRIETNLLFNALQSYSNEVEGFPANADEFANLSANDMNHFATEIILSDSFVNSGDMTMLETADNIVKKKEAEELDALYTVIERAGLSKEDGLPDRKKFTKLGAQDIEELADKANKKRKFPGEASMVDVMLEPVLEMKVTRQIEPPTPEELSHDPNETDRLIAEAMKVSQQAEEAMRVNPPKTDKSTSKQASPIKQAAPKKESTPKKEGNRVTFKDAMELKNESIREKNAEQSALGNLGNRVKGVGRILYGATVAMPVEGVKGMFNAVRAVPVMVGGAAKAAAGAITGNQDLKENGVSMMSAGGHMAMQGVTAFARAPVSLIKEGAMNIATGQRQENTFRAKQHATRLTREKGKGNLDLSDKKLAKTSKTTQKIVEKMRSNSDVQQGSGVQQSAAGAGQKRSQTTSQML